MIFSNLLKDKYEKLIPSFDCLFALAIQNQTYDGDLLLVRENAGYFKYVEQWDNADPYTIGPQLQGHNERTNYDYIGDYVKKTSSLTSEEYSKSVIFDSERIKEIDLLIQQEAKSIQDETTIYLKIWETETFIKKMHQLTLLVNGNDYDWHFKIKTHDKSDLGGLSKSHLLKNIIENFKSNLPNLSISLNKCYRSQLRNAIAHSQYSTVGRSLILNNYDETKIDSVFSIGFDEWIDIFHETLMIFSLYMKLMNLINEMYYQLSLNNNKSFQIRINRLYPTQETTYFNLYTRDIFKDWGYQELD